MSGVRLAPPLDGWLVRHGGRGHRLDDACLRKVATRPASHDTSVPGLLDVATVARDPALDLTAPCRHDTTG
jgi:lipid A ethanolaminephosphotransferase